MKARLIVFDLDGTLIDTMTTYADKASVLIAEHFGLSRETARRLYIETSGQPFQQQLDQLFPGVVHNREVALQFETWKDTYLREVSLPSATEAILCTLQNKGFKIAISSNNLARYVERMAQAWPVDAALGYHPEIAFGKGAPHFDWLTAYFQLSRSDLLFIGDSIYDAHIARDCGVAFIGALGDFFTEKDFKMIHPELVAIESLDILLRDLVLPEASTASKATDLAKSRIRGTVARSRRPEDPGHAENTLKWLLTLDQKADSALQLAALAHDIDRAVPGTIQRIHFDSYDAFKATHAGHGADILYEILKDCGISPEVNIEACRLVRLHEVGGDSRSDLLCDADGISYFDYNLRFYLERNGWDAALQRSIWGYQRLSHRARKIVQNLIYDDSISNRLLQASLEEGQKIVVSTGEES